MRIQLIGAIIAIIFALGLIGWGLFSTSGSESEIQAKIDELTPASEKKEINVNILKQNTVTETLTRRVFGNLPSGEDSNVGRDNPFEGI